jgi:hypothetical protein
VKATGVQAFSELVTDSQGIINLPAQPAGTELDLTVTARNATGGKPGDGGDHFGVAVSPPPLAT